MPFTLVEMGLLGGLLLLLALSVSLLLKLRALTVNEAASRLEGELLRLDARLDGRLSEMAKGGANREATMRQEFAQSRQELAQNREELAKSLQDVRRTLTQMGESQTQAQTDMRNKMDEKMRELQLGNEKKLDEMRKTVDEHLQTALERRITESFKTVAERLEAVQKGLGEMQSLATGVGDLKRVLTNVKSRGTFGEVQLEALIVDMLTPDQFIANYDCGKSGRERVEFGIRLPGTEVPIHLPVDAKFPVEDYERLLAASEVGDRAGVDAASKELERKIRSFASDISKKYINPPATTEWAILFLPTESLYAEVLRRPGLFEQIQKELRVVIAGPTNLQVLLSTFRMGYRQVAMNEKAQSVMQVLGAVRGEFDKFGSQISATAKSLEAARNHVDRLATRRSVMLRALKNVEAIDEETSERLLGNSEERANE